MVMPVSVAAAVEMDLQEYGAVEPPLGTPLDGPMTHAGQVFWRSDDGSIATGLWECSAGRMQTDFGDGGEMVHVVTGTIRAVSDDGEEQVIGPGESATFPPGWKGVWTLETPMRKLYCTFKLGD